MTVPPATLDRWATRPLTAAQPPRLLLVLDPARLWRWQKWLAEALASEGRCSVEFAFVDARQALPSPLRLLMVLEGLLFDAPSSRASDLLGDAELKGLPVAGTGGAAYDLAIDFTGRAKDIKAARVVRPAFDGIAGDAGAIAALLERRAPRLGLLDSDAGLKELGTCALEHPEIFSRGLDGVFSRMAGLLLNAVRMHRPASNGTTAIEPMRPQRTPATPSLAASATFLSTAIARKSTARLAWLLGQAPRWSVAWRRSNGAPSHETLEIPWQNFTRLPGDGRRYYADPFVLLREGIAHVFCEEVPFATGKGVISHFTIEADGNASTPHPVLEQPYHLSYPFVFERDGTVWMIPESSANRTVELYRAERFPDRWVKEGVLLDGILADDATLIERDGRFWLFAAVRDWQASSWEALGLFHADALTGPWQAHSGNPVLLDPTSARPAGALFTHQGQLIRPAQDCGRGYGTGLAFCRVDRLDETGFAQSVLTRVVPRTRQVRGLHTYNRAGNIEVIDLFGSI
jgi:hypothetical protein